MRKHYLMILQYPRRKPTSLTSYVIPKPSGVGSPRADPCTPREAFLCHFANSKSADFGPEEFAGAPVAADGLQWGEIKPRQGARRYSGHLAQGSLVPLNHSSTGRAHQKAPSPSQKPREGAYMFLFSFVFVFLPVFPLSLSWLSYPMHHQIHFYRMNCVSVNS